jgi:hypothetical protein
MKTELPDGRFLGSSRPFATMQPGPESDQSVEGKGEVEGFESEEMVSLRGLYNSTEMGAALRTNPRKTADLPKGSPPWHPNC